MIKFTEHAKQMLIKRGISQNKVKQCLKAPNITKTSAADKKILFKDFGKNFLKVVIAEEGEDQVVITQHWIDKRRVIKV